MRNSSQPHGNTITRSNSATRRIAVGLFGSVVFAALTWVGANITIPVQPVPITLQTMFVVLAGAILGASFGGFSQGLYVTLGVVGLPIFASGAVGAGVLTGITGGYLVGFVVAPAVVGRLIGLHRSVAWHALVFAIGSLVILALGTLHIRAFYVDSFARAIAVGFVPFLIGGAIKVAAATSIYRSYLGVRQLRRR